MSSISLLYNNTVLPLFCGSLDSPCVLLLSPVILGLTPCVLALSSDPLANLVPIGCVLLARCGCYFEVAMVTYNSWLLAFYEQMGTNRCEFPLVYRIRGCLWVSLPAYL